ncbi:element excision factor XisH family protein [cf. Phormidesmis sp. LEGE 11477]|uniref:element excision factor XisH family protein n=1 Tax=cf. Phormidesmis sp. LEGE 11477 TaxID=1828680 RepID=UPI001880CC88|nr:element excision factor XisH family protein [cf. Phormidesmis sp. LEGE 11477]MBE9063018.1 hypothetical protein [cf. Phormidesmis sp. LEGE 11477]
MSKRDVFHEAVKRGLEKEQWHISKDPLKLRIEDLIRCTFSAALTLALSRVRV